MNVLEQILEARARYLIERRALPNRLRMPPTEWAMFCDWLHTIENDPFLGYSPFGKQLFGMVFSEDATITEITIDQH